MHGFASISVRAMAYIGEAVLLEQTGTVDMRRYQLHHLLDMTSRANIAIRVVPLRVEWHPGMSGPFVLYDFPDASPVVHFEHHSTGAFINNPHDIAAYKQAVEWLDRIALDQDASSAAIAAVIKEMEVNND